MLCVATVSRDSFGYTTTCCGYTAAEYADGITWQQVALRPFGCCCPQVSVYKSRICSRALSHRAKRSCGTPGESRSVVQGAGKHRKKHPTGARRHFTGWSDSRFNNPRFRCSLETKEYLHASNAQDPSIGFDAVTASNAGCEDKSTRLSAGRTQAPRAKPGV